MLDKSPTDIIQPQYDLQFADVARRGGVQLGPMLGVTWRYDPKRLVFVLARYKFVAKMLSGKARVVEIGCGEGFGAALVRQSVGSVFGIDIDSRMIDYAKGHAAHEELDLTYAVANAVSGVPGGPYDAAYSLDVIEHIPAHEEVNFVRGIVSSLVPAGVCIIGTPNITSEAYASEGSKIGHINLKSAETLRALLEDFFDNIFIFSMNDEVVHTGFSPMAHYTLAVCAGVRQTSRNSAA